MQQALPLVVLVVVPLRLTFQPQPTVSPAMLTNIMPFIHHYAVDSSLMLLDGPAEFTRVQGI
jgi:hypothetical protein